MIAALVVVVIVIVAALVAYATIADERDAALHVKPQPAPRSTSEKRKGALPTSLPPSLSKLRAGARADVE